LSRHEKNSTQGLRVEVRNDDVNKALRLFKKKVQDSGILQELKEKEFYEKPTTKRKRAKAAAKARWNKKLANMQGTFDQSGRKGKGR
jgi:small subunit ribosomal protein S21